ncbi:MAG: hypothetical protein KF862_03750 [Chitinophagaceae bacterium]|nr:hypothetical protein [Chitinophagaceae bacterium]
MHPYLPHLLADIAAAHRSTSEPPQQHEQSLKVHFEEIERWVAGEMEEHTLGYYSGLESQNFPPPGQFTQKELRIIWDAFSRMLSSWNASLDLPKKMPLHIKYGFMVGMLNKPFMVVDHGNIGFDYCTGYAPGCELKEYCPCLEIWNKPDLPVSG